jgi:hypothetical protein
MKLSAKNLLLLLIFGLITACEATPPAPIPATTATPEVVDAADSPTLAITAMPEVKAAAASPTSPAETPLPAQAAPPAVSETEPIRAATVAEAELLAGFKVRMPAYLPEGVSFDYALVQKAPNPQVALQFKIVHPQYGDMGRFFQIMQAPRPGAPAEASSCSGSSDGACEVLQIAAQPVIYHLYTAGTESLDWYANGVAFWLLRTAGEPGKVYKDVLVKVAESLK